MGYWLEFADSVKYMKNLDSYTHRTSIQGQQRTGGASEDSPSFVSTARLMSSHIFIIAGGDHTHFIW